MEKLHLSDDQMRTFFGDYGEGEGRKDDHLGKGRPGEKVGVERTTRTEYVLIYNIDLASIYPYFQFREQIVSEDL